MFQRLIIIGNLGRDPELRFTQDGNPVTTLSVATSRKYKDKDETTWFRVIVYGKQAESCNQYLTKGSKVLVEGRLIPDANGGPKVYQKKDGTWGASFDVTADSVRFLSSKQDDEGSKVLVEDPLIPDANGGPKVYQKKDGTWGASYDGTAENVRFLSSREEEVSL